jgi:predicted nucleic acid-binding protein
MVRQLLQSLPALVLDQESADRAAAVRRSLDARGESIGMADSLIAGIALVHDAFLLTRNIHHFNRVLGLRLAEIPEV